MAFAPAGRVSKVQLPMIPLVTDLIAAHPGTISLGQGMVGFGPPAEALRCIPGFLAEGDCHLYPPDPGLPALRAAFAEKLRRENGHHAPAERIMVTVGANQGFFQALLCICDPGDEVILLRPYYFNHEMAVGLAGARAVVVDTDDEYLPRPDAIAAAIGPRTRAVVTVSPNNPTGAVYPAELLRAINELCAEHGLYHISDETYEYFTFDGVVHASPGAPGVDRHTIALYSLSKAYGFASWRVGFAVVPEHLFGDLVKVMDTNTICAPAVSQAVALELLRIGRGYTDGHVRAIADVRAAALHQLENVADLATVPPARGALYFFLRVHTAMPGLELCQRLVREHRVGAVPGETFGMETGCYLRASYGMLDRQTATEGFRRLATGLRAIVGPQAGVRGC